MISREFGTDVVRNWHASAEAPRLGFRHAVVRGAVLLKSL